MEVEVVITSNYILIFYLLRSAKTLSTNAFESLLYLAKPSSTDNVPTTILEITSFFIVNKSGIALLRTSEAGNKGSKTESLVNIASELVILLSTTTGFLNFVKDNSGASYIFGNVF